MKRITLYNSNKKAMVNDEDYQELLHHKWYLNPTGYVVSHQRSGSPSRSQTIYMQKFLLKPPDGLQVDHIDRNKLNNQRNNLRLATRWQNHGNKAKQRGKYSSKYKGVSWQPAYGKWYALICCQGKQYNLGRYVEEIDAARAYDAKARELFGEFALTNFPV